MGLDMYLYKKTYVKNWDHQKPEEQHQVTVLKGFKPRTDIKTERISYITEEVAYWRKFNALHGWFVENCGGGEDNCQEIYVGEEKMNEILNILKQVQDILSRSTKTTKTLVGFGGNTETAEVYDCDEAIEDLLPPTSGFFFGGTEIDEWYKQNVDDTIVVLEELLKEQEQSQQYGLHSGDFYYRASW